MYKDSDGYILIDMSGADISKSSQNIIGFYDRIVESINTNKLVLVINFGNYSPMPAIAHKKLNYYVIVTNLYKITINSNDIVLIEETGESTVDVSIIPTLQAGVKIADFSIGEVDGSLYAPAQSSIINDNVTADNTTWSSDKIDNELDSKVDASSLAAVATSGSYNDLTNTPVLADVAISGSYTDLTNKPTLATVATTGSYNDLTNTPVLADVAISGSYTDLTNKPTIPADLDDLSDVTLTTPTNGQTLVYDATASMFVNATPPSGVTTLAGLSDVSLSTPASGNSLVFDGTDWSNTTIDAADISYSQGVSVADKLDSLDNISQITAITTDSTGIADNDTLVVRVGNLLILNLSFTLNTTYSAQWKDIFSFDDTTLQIQGLAGFLGVVSTEANDNTYGQLYLNTNTNKVTYRVRSGVQNKTYRGQLIVPISNSV